MIVTTSQLSIICTYTSDWLEVSIYPNCVRGKEISNEVVIKYGEGAIESDYDISEMIGKINGESTWKKLYLSGQNLEPACEDDFIKYEITPIAKRVHAAQKLDHFIIFWKDLWANNSLEIRFIEEDINYKKSMLSLKTAMRLEALKRIRQAYKMASSGDFAFDLFVASEKEIG